jgi:hypothetical protein
MWEYKVIKVDDWGTKKTSVFDSDTGHREVATGGSSWSKKPQEVGMMEVKAHAEILNMVGAENWELVGITYKFCQNKDGTTWYTFKRPKTA